MMLKNGREYLWGNKVAGNLITKKIFEIFFRGSIDFLILLL